MRYACLIFAIILTIYQGYRGYRLQNVLGPVKEKFPKCDQIIVLSLADTILYAICSAVGFISLWIAYEMTGHYDIKTLQSLTTGSSVFLLFFILLGLLGVTGQLPYLIQQGKILPHS